MKRISKDKVKVGDTYLYVNGGAVEEVLVIGFTPCKIKVLSVFQPRVYDHTSNTYELDGDVSVTRPRHLNGHYLFKPEYLFKDVPKEDYPHVVKKHTARNGDAA
jgi:hypothetical protein